MPVHMALAACVMAALPISALLAQSQDTDHHYCYEPDGCTAQQKLQAMPPQTNAAIPACDSHSQAEAEEALDHALQAIKIKAMPSAVCWLNVAAAQNIPVAFGGLASIYFKGTGGVPVDLERALYYAEKA